MAKTGKIRRYRKPLNINAGLVIFGIIFIYIIICIFLYFTSSHIHAYEVTVGSLAQTNNYTGLALREEQIVNAAESGYVYYYARQGERVGVKTPVYSIDESGSLYDYLEANADTTNSITDEDLKEIKSKIITFIYDLKNGNYNNTYSFKYDLEDVILNYQNLNLLSNAGNITGAEGSNLFTLYTASNSGILIDSTDGFEGMTIDTITKDSFNTQKYQVKQLKNNDIINKDEPVYKLITSEDWSIVFQLDKDRAEQLKDQTYLKVKFKKTGDEAWGAFSIINKDDGIYGKLDFSNSMINYATDRYIEIELQVEEEAGLKIPKSSVVNKPFYLIPKDYVTKGGDSNSDGVLAQTYSKNGEASTKFVETSIYASNDQYYYVDTSLFKPGDIIIKPNSNETYTISTTDTLVGVYNINKGFADFRQITILNENDEYCIVKSNTEYGLAVYDHIALIGKSVEENDIVY